MKEQSERTVNNNTVEEDLIATTQEFGPSESTYPEPKEKKRKKRKFGKREILMIVIPAVAAVAAVVVASLFVKNVTKQTTGAGGKQYYLDSEQVIKEGTVIKKSEDGSTYIETNQNDIQIPELPIYYEDRIAMMITEDMVWSDPRTGRFLRADHFSEFSLGAGNCIHVSFGGVDKVIDYGFLYNGKDLYIFLEPMTLTVEQYAVEVPAFSYIEAVYGDSIVLFNYETKESEIFGTGDGAEVINEDYSVQILNDTEIMPDGKRRLLFNAPGQLKPLVGKDE